MNEAQRQSFIRLNGLEAYEALPFLPPTPPASPTRDDRGRFTVQKKRSEMSVDEKAEYIAKYGVDAFLALPYT